MLDVKMDGTDLTFEVRWKNTEVRLESIIGDGALEQCQRLVVEKFGQEVWDSQVANFADGRRRLAAKKAREAAATTF